MAIDLQEYEGRIVAYASKFRYYYDMDDLIQVGRIGLLNALIIMIRVRIRSFLLMLFFILKEKF